MTTRLLVIACLLAAAGCASSPSSPPTRSGSDGAARDCTPARDREAILQMAGTFDVDFDFRETRALVEGYELHEDYHSEASEVVIVLEATDMKISLQHVLLIPQDAEPSVPMKHWRQDWAFEDVDLLEFQGERVWKHRRISAEEARCAWTQSVYQVDDGPRYESLGRFTYREDGTAVWTSEETWRPLPRREYTKRDDYDVLIATNRHVIGSDGWRHEQQNRKWVIDDARSLVEEQGLNVYRRVSLDDAAVARRFMKQTGVFWADVRSEWSQLLSSGEVVLVKDSVGGKRLFLSLFNHDEDMAKARPRTRRDFIARTIGPYVEPLDP